MEKQYGIFVALDLETSGIDEDEGHPLEIAAKALDHNLEPIGDFHSLIKAHENFLDESQFQPAAWEMHQENGLLQDLRDNEHTNSLTDCNGVALRLNAWLDEIKERYIAANPEMEQNYANIFLVGNNVENFDLRWLRVWMPSVTAKFHYRTINVSSLRMTLAVAMKLDQHGLKEHMGFGGHRAKDDVRSCIMEWKRYIDIMNAGSVEFARRVAEQTGTLKTEA